MREFVAKNSKQLDICLRLLYAEQVEFLVNVREVNEKIQYVVYVTADDEQVTQLLEKYRILTS